MKSLISFAALAVTAFALNQPADAQTANAGANSSSSSGSSSGASSSSGSTSNSGASANSQRSQQRATNNTNTNTPITFNSTTPDRLTTNNNSTGSGTYTNNTNNSGYTSSDVTVRTTPTVYAPPVSGGNPCTLAVSGGVSVIGWGAAAGGTFVDTDCARRQQAAMMHNAGYAGPAKEMMCDDKSAYYAFRRAGQPCQLRPEWEPAGVSPPIVQQQPTPIAPPPARVAGPLPSAQTLPRCNVARGIVDNCFSG